MQKVASMRWVMALALVAGTAAAQQPAAQQQPAGQQQPAAQRHVRGDVVALDGNTLEVKTRIGQDVKLKLPEGARVATVDNANLDSIGQGVFIGTTAVPQPDGTLRAVEVHVFPESMRGTGEGFRPWDLQPRSTMTNATVAKVQPQGAPGGRSTMTNATVTKVGASGGGRKLELKYKDGEKTVVVPPGTPVVKIEPADRSSLVPGAHLFAIVTAQPDGTLVADRVTVGKNGVAPPM